MSVRLYEKRSYKGKSLKVTSNVSDLSTKKFNNKASSLKLTSKSDRALFFKKKNYKGGVMFRDGKESIPILSSVKDEGKAGFGNAISSVRFSPFYVDLVVYIIRDANGDYPGSMRSFQLASEYVEDMVAAANKIWKKGLLQLRISSIKAKTSAKYYDLTKAEFVGTLCRKWKEKNKVRVFLVDQINSKTKCLSGISMPPGAGKAIAIDYQNRNPTRAGSTLAHEIGHTFGIHHHSGKKAGKKNLMHPDRNRSTGTGLKDTQIAKVHRVLAKNVFRKGMRSK